MTQETTTVRGNILKQAQAATEGDRNQSYGDPTVQLALAGEIKDLLRKYYGEHALRAIGPSEWEATDSEVTKISRRILGRYHPDNYVDSAAYAAIAGECAWSVQLNKYKEKN